MYEGLTSNSDDEEDKKNTTDGDAEKGNGQESEKAEEGEGSSNAAPIHRYTSFPAEFSRPFRLLRLLPGNRDETLECQLFEASLDEQAENYEALSYVWGDASNRVSIRVNGVPFRISKNLRDALLDLRHATNTRVVWADAICINQNDSAERDSQVASMRAIYQNASQTVVWLGPEMSKKTPRAFELIQKLYNDALDVRKSGKAVERWKGKEYSKLMLDDTMEAVFMRHPWWLRVWTAQEILLARRATIVSGSCEVEWDEFCTAVNYGDELGIFQIVVLGVVPQAESWMVTAVQALKNAPSHSNPADELFYYLLRTRGRGATDPRDKIFAVLGLVSSNIQELGIHPDYHASTEQVYCEATRRLMAVSGSLDVLGVCFPFEDRVVPELPSWVPDWGSQGYVASPLIEDAHGAPRTTHASRRLPAKPTWQDDGNTLVVEGHVVDVITQLSVVADRYDEDKVWNMEEFENDYDNAPFYQELLDAFGMLGRGLGNLPNMITHVALYIEWEEFVKGLKPTNPNSGNGDLMSIYCQTLSTGTMAPGGLQETETLFKTWLDQLAPIRSLRNWKVNRIGGTFKLLSLLGYIKTTWNGYGEFLTYITPSTERRMGACEKGYLCLLPKLTQVGDKLVILKGGRVPVILRPRHDGSMEFIGEAYVHGIMNGEAFEEDKCAEMRIA
ncbi:heterokaryon incompatibility protein-domain-containing protein [Cercophora newfieldiana]|uniref:Heterokaryon incompatibility protein-domain-containing protein n=1 Tax=Cercophora newfieldiana TaxID=92897 RepID=A0AA39XS14_9PEZI|nr:heterokaryon incompatibility protein-domain-containing protein [Cercophora newfieldiana]